jgi:hypothetical protein
MINVSQDLETSQARLRSSLRVLDNDKCEPGVSVLILQPGPRFRSSFKILHISRI